MTSETGSASQPSQESKPWEQAWNDLSAGLKTVKDAVVDTVSEPFVKPPKAPPWERQWGVEGAPKEPRKVPENQFDVVFNRLIGAESNGVHSKNGKLTTSPKGAEGLTQVMPATAAKPGYGVKPIQDRSEQEYKRFGRDYLKAMLNEFDNDYEKAVAAYNAGAGSVKDAVNKGGKNWKNHLPMPKETLPYIEKILGNSKHGEGRTQSDSDARRAGYEKLPIVTGKEILASGMDTKASRASWYAKMEKEWTDGQKGMSRQAKDKYFSDPAWMAKTKYPKEYALWERFESEGIDGFSDHVRSMLDSNNPNYSLVPQSTSESGASGWIYSIKPDRAFLGQTANTKTMVHETEHLLQNKDLEKNGVNASHYQAGKMGAMNSPIRKLAKWAADNKDDPDVREVFSADNAHDSMNEWLANLSGFWKTQIPSGKSWSDTKFYKKLEKSVGKEQAQTMMIDSLSTLVRAPYTKDR